jgi:hypothetical protein
MNNITQEQQNAILQQTRMVQAQAMEQAVGKMTDRCFTVSSSSISS